MGLDRAHCAILNICTEADYRAEKEMKILRDVCQIRPRNVLSIMRHHGIYFG